MCTLMVILLSLKQGRTEVFTHLFEKVSKLSRILERI